MAARRVCVPGLHEKDRIPLSAYRLAASRATIALPYHIPQSAASPADSLKAAYQLALVIQIYRPQLLALRRLPECLVIDCACIRAGGRGGDNPGVFVRGGLSTGFEDWNKELHEEEVS